MQAEKVGFFIRVEFQGRPRFVRVDQVIAIEEHEGHTSIVLSRNGGMLHQLMCSNKGTDVAEAVGERLQALAAGKLIESVDPLMVDTLDGRMATFVKETLNRELEPMVRRSLALMADDAEAGPAAAEGGKKARK